MRGLVISGALLLAACAGPKIAPPPQATVVPPAGWRANATATSGAEISADWWQAFGDPVLTHIVETALANNVDIALAATRVANARGQFHLARAQQLPNIGAAGGGGRDRDVNPGFGVPELQTTGAGELRASFDLDLFGRLANATEAARASLLASEAARDNVRLAVASSAASGYITLRALDTRLSVLRDTLAERDAELNIARRSAAAGYTSQLNLTQAEADDAATQQLIPATELAITHQEDGLSLLLGDTPRTIERGKDFNALAAPAVPVSLPAALLRRRPDIEAAEQQLVAADHALDSARAAFMPDINLAAAAGYVGSSIIPGSPIGVWSLGGSILAPIFDSGRLQAQQDSATARRDQAAFAYRKTALTSFREVEDALAAVQRDGEQEKALGTESDVLNHTLALATSRYRAGYSPYLDQLDAQRSLLSARLALVQAHADKLMAIVSLYQSVGGGWQRADDRQAGNEGAAHIADGVVSGVRRSASK